MVVGADDQLFNAISHVGFQVLMFFIQRIDLIQGFAPSGRCNDHLYDEGISYHQEQQQTAQVKKIDNATMSRMGFRMLPSSLTA
jgi:hypothetical protein